jgi:hypothetical protein
MPDVVRALAISAGILSSVVVLIVILTIVVVRRGEAGHVEAEHEGDRPAVQETAPVSPAATAGKPGKPAKPGAAPGEEISVLQILLYGTGVFVVTILLLLGLSLVQHMM